MGSSLKDRISYDHKVRELFFKELTQMTRKKTVADYPAIADQWHRTKNGTILPNQVAAGSHTKYWWECLHGPDHQWTTSPNGRTGGKKLKGCPFCAGQKVSVTNSLEKQHPKVAAEWHPTLNNDWLPSDVVWGSKKKFWWKCPQGPDHEWEAVVGNRTRLNAGCPCCAGQKVSVTNSLKNLHPNVAAEWHPTKNGDLTPDQVVAGSDKKHWWACLKGPDHNWEASSDSRTGKSRTGCPYCAGHKVSVTNSLESLHKEVAAEWHPIKNKTLVRSEVIAGSNKKYWWLCPRGLDHEWEATADSRTGKRRSGCPFCDGKKVSYTNSLGKLFPVLAAEWDSTLNGDLSPDEIVAGTPVKYWWTCPQGPDHKWKASVTLRTGKRKAGCPFCAGYKVSVTNSLENLFPNIAAQWHPTKNGDLMPDQVVAGSHVKHWWQCPQAVEHEWEAQCVNRTTNETGCPFCLVLPRSKIEMYIAVELTAFFDFDLEEHKIDINGKIFDVDIVVRNFNLLIEFDGEYWHRDKVDTDIIKTTLLSDAGWKVIRIRETPLKLLSSSDIQAPVATVVRDIKGIVNKLLIHIGKMYEIDIRDLNRYLKRKTLLKQRDAEAYIENFLTEKAVNKKSSWLQ